MNVDYGMTLGQEVIRTLSRYPSRTAFSWDGGSWTYAHSLEMLGRMQAAFFKNGLESGDTVVVLSSNRAEAWCAGAAAQCLGAAMSPLHPLASLDDHLYQIADCKPAFLIIDALKHADRGRALVERIDPGIKVLSLGPSDFAPDLLQICADAGTASATNKASLDDVCTILYTGGSTGRSKGVVRTNRAYSYFTAMTIADYDMTGTPNFLAAAPISHVAYTFVLPTLARGGTIHLMRGFDPHQTLRTIEQKKISFTLAVPTMIYGLMDTSEVHDTDLSALTRLVYGGSPMSPTQLERGLDLFGPVFCQLYGTTETFAISALSPEDHDLSRKELFSSCGTVSKMGQIKLLNDDGHEVPLGEVGEICVRSPLNMSHYLNLPEETAETIKDGWVHTGDLAHANEEGFHFIVDRKKDMIVTGGFNVYPRGIEDCLTTDSSVSMAAVIGVPDKRWGEAVKAFVVPTSGEAPDEAVLKSLVKEKLGSVQTPKSIEFVDALPLTAVGKVDKKELRKAYWSDQKRQVG